MKKAVIVPVILIFIIIIIVIPFFICTVSNQKVQLMEGTVLLTKGFNVKPSPIVPVALFTTEDLAAVPLPRAEVQTTAPILTPVQPTKLPQGSIESTNALKTASVYEIEHPVAPYTFEPTPKLAPYMAAPATEGTWKYRDIAPTRVVKSGEEVPFTLPSTNLRPPKE